jgi:sulfide:quinone oxidoreductase
VAVFKNLDTGEITNEKYDLLHVVPPLAPPAVVKSSPLAAASGFVEVDQYTLQSTKYSNVFALGDCTTTPNSKTAAAVTKQAPILVHNLQQVMEDKPANAKYNGYASCPLIIGKNHVILAEFGYGGKIMETFSRETGKFPYSLIGQEGAVQQRLFYWMKKDMFPYVYWNLWTKGKWFGNSGPFKPNVLEDDGATTAKK